MLACFRSVARQKFAFRPLSASLFSSSSSLREQVEDENVQALEDFKKLGENLGHSESSNPTVVDVGPNSPWRGFSPNTFIRPDRLSYKSVLKKTPLPVSRPAVGPSKMEARKSDPFYLMDVDPLSQAMNPAMLIPFVSEMGKIYGRNVTKLTKKNQRRVGKAIRRAKMMGILPILHSENIFLAKGNRS